MLVTVLKIFVIFTKFALEHASKRDVIHLLDTIYRCLDTQKKKP